MKQVIDETIEIAYGYLSTFGFTKVQVDTLVMQGENELSATLQKFVALEISSANLDEINDVLHALQGLFSQLGNEKISEKLYEIKESDSISQRLSEISKLLGVEIALDSTSEETCKIIV